MIAVVFAESDVLRSLAFNFPCSPALRRRRSIGFAATGFVRIGVRLRARARPMAAGARCRGVGAAHGRAGVGMTPGVFKPEGMGEAG